jgi:hypothetical protein
MAAPETHNLFSTVALLLWPLIAAFLFRTLPLGKAILWTILGAQLLLPTRSIIKFEMIPQFDKESIPNLCILIASILVLGRLPRIFGRTALTTALIALYLFGSFITSQLNGDDIVAGNVVLPGVGLYDAFSSAELNYILLIPFFVGRQFLWREQDLRNVFVILVSAELVYTIPLLFEIRFSPQLHYWVYGYYPSDFQQAIREGGAFRPMVFMGHGLAAAFFLMTATIASAVLWRTKVRIFGQPTGRIGGYLAVVLILCNSLGSLAYGILFAPLVRFARPEIQIRLAVLLVSIALIYPTLRASGLFPTNFLLGVANTISGDRARSLKTRFDNEDKLLAHALERPFFGWGRYGRSRVYDERTGKDESITDGRWLITLGQFGLFGFLGEFGLLTFVVFRASSALRFCRSESDRMLLSALSLIVAINVVDLLPNSGLVPWTWLICGALLGRSEMLLRTKPLINRRSTPKTFVDSWR